VQAVFPKAWSLLTEAGGRFSAPGGVAGGRRFHPRIMHMRQTTLLAGISLLSLAAGVAVPASAQTTRGETTTTTTTERYYMPYEKNFWSNFGINAGGAKYDRDCSGSCDDKDTGFKVYAGGKFRDWLGLEVSYLDLGSAQFNGTSEHARGLNVSAVLGIPLGGSSSIFAKGGATYGRLTFGGDRETGWEPSVGLGAAIGINRNWQVRVDWDRLRFEAPGSGKDNVNMVSAGLQFRY
jgi:OmpA-OmpF porin, OOP family